jgi:caa(3)-type oxidase subunit IV
MSAEHAEHHTNYVKIWAILLVLLVISIVGPMFEIQVLTLVTAFGIALVKAYLVAAKFMHLDTEKKWVSYLLLTCIAFMVLLFGGVAADVMKHDGQNWTNDAAKHEVQRALAAEKAGGGDHH